MHPPSGYLKHLSDVYPPTGKEHSLLPWRECLTLKPPFWNNKTWHHRNGRASFYPSLSFPVSRRGDEVLVFVLLPWPCCFRLPLRYSQLVAGFLRTPPPVGWRQVWAENGGSLLYSVEFDTLHLHLQQWRPGIWHTTPTPAVAQRLHTEQWNFTLKCFRPPYAQISAPLVWKNFVPQSCICIDFYFFFSNWLCIVFSVVK